MNIQEELYAKVLLAKQEGKIDLKLADTLLMHFFAKARAKKNKIFSNLYMFIDKILMRHKTDKNLENGYYDSVGEKIKHSDRHFPINAAFQHGDNLLARGNTAEQLTFDLNTINNNNTHETLADGVRNEKYVVVIQIGKHKYQLKFLKKMYSYFGKESGNLIFSQDKEGLLYIKNKGVDSAICMPFKQI
jgi:hypothetical protein